MPTYEYGCPAGHRFEKFYRKISDATGEVVCPECGQVATRRMSAGAGLIFKGSGFYITDYGKDGKKSQTPAAASSDSASSTSGAAAPPSGSAPSDSGGSETKRSETTASESAPTAAKPADSKPPSSPSGGSASE